MEILFMITAALSFALLSAQSAQNFPPPLPKEREAELFFKKMEGDEEARNLLIEHNLRLVAHIVRKYYASWDCQDDLISVGTLGLIKAVDTFKITNGARFATYGSKCIQNEILMHFRAKKKTSMEVSINETIDTDRDGNPLTYMDIIRCEDTIADDLDVRMQVKSAIYFIRHNLDERERQIMILRYGIGGKKPLTQRETAQHLGISRSYVSRIEKGALQKIHEYLKRGRL
ncbi:MAG: RNA polymerase sporulation sigma factor SigK [Clostridiales bacterium]|jgi:RNA polymerase sporulation-specific sigma factor|nr:RNA polymerase sporulation sigma factor SigK [Clostridiales bacterium]